jgi:predicted CXXCH cytochrome family protein
MAYLIRFITKNAAGGVEHHDQPVDAEAITIGRSTDQVLHLKDRRARLQHAVIEPKDNAFRITTNTMAGVTVNRKSQRSTKLEVGDVIEVGANIIRVIDAPEGFEFAISFELRDDADGEFLISRWSTPTSGIGGWSKRKIAWSLVAIVLLLGFTLPALVMHDFLLAGPVSSVHASIASECGSCHTTLFKRVPDEACIECHAVQRHTTDSQHAVLGETRCATCHLEHNEPAQLVNQHQDLCAGCHADLPSAVDLQNATDFLDGHPDFKVSLKRPASAPDGEVEWLVEHIDLDSATSADTSNLSFNHKIHLDSDGIITPDGMRVIECAECHTPDPGGARMQAISMDEHCSDCHTLAFDPDDPTRTVPHGDADAVVQALIEYYSARLLGSDPDAVDQRVRRPGKRLSRADRDRVAAEARTEALTIAEDLFERRACVNCHTVTKTGGAVPWQVEPVQLTELFFPHAVFSHASHDTDVGSCDSCHGASKSEVATDLLIPNISVCRDCHGSGESGRNSSTQIPSTCVMCHGFHFETKDTYP